MKRLLLGSSALVAASVLPLAAQAAEWEISLGGFYNAAIGFTDTDTFGDPNSINFGSDGEIHFRPTITLDNGLTFGGNFELELERDADVGSGDLIDESFIFIRGSFGEVILGQHNGAFSRAGDDIIPSYGGHSVAGGEDHGPMDVFAPYDVDTGLTFTSLRNRINTDSSFDQDDDIRISYFTPSFSGFQLGASYAPNPCKNDTGYADCVFDEFGRNRFEVSARWEHGFDLGVGLGLYGAYAQGESGNSVNDPTEWTVGARLGFSGFEFGAQYVEHDTRFEDPLSTRRFDTKVQFVGSVQYETGPWTVFGQAGRSESGNRDAFERNEGQYDRLHTGVQYNLGPGIDVGLQLQHVEFERDTRGGITNDFDTSATAGLGFLSLSF